MLDMEKVMTGLELCTNISPDGCLMLCPYKDEKDETYSGFCEQVLKQDAIDLLKDQEETISNLNETIDNLLQQIKDISQYMTPIGQVRDVKAFLEGRIDCFGNSDLEGR